MECRRREGCHAVAEARLNLTVISEHKVEILVCTHVSFLLVTMPTCGVISPMSPLSACWS